MIAGWKLNPLWRIYWAQRTAERLRLLASTQQEEQQQEALDAVAQQIMEHAQRVAMRNNTPRH